METRETNINKILVFSILFSFLLSFYFPADYSSPTTMLLHCRPLLISDVRAATTTRIARSARSHVTHRRERCSGRIPRLGYVLNLQCLAVFVEKERRVCDSSAHTNVVGLVLWRKHELLVRGAVVHEARLLAQVLLVAGLAWKLVPHLGGSRFVIEFGCDAQLADRLVQIFAEEKVVPHGVEDRARDLEPAGRSDTEYGVFRDAVRDDRASHVGLWNRVW